MLEFEDVVNLYLKEVDQAGEVSFNYWDDADFKYPVVATGGETDSHGNSLINTYVATEDILTWFDNRLRKIEEKLGLLGERV
jgi:hypothetical protein